MRLLASLVCAAVLVVAPPARAEEAAPPPADDAAPPVSRPWLYLDDPRLPAPMHVVALTRASYTQTLRGSPTRPFASNLASPGGMFEVGGELGLAPWMSVQASAVGSTEAGVSPGMTAAARFAPFRWRDTQLTFSVGYLRELRGDSGAWGRASLTHDLGRLRLGGTMHGEHVFAPARDGVDVMVTMGGSYRVAGAFRVGAEYVAQDLEGAVDDEEAEGGMRHFVGSTLSAVLLGDRLTIAAGPAFGLSPESPRLLGRLQIAYAF